MYCLSCGESIDEGSRFCRHCGAAQESTARAPDVVTPQSPAESASLAGTRSNRWLAWAGGGVLALIAFAILASQPSGSPDAHMNSLSSMDELANIQATANADTQAAMDSVDKALTAAGGVPSDTPTASWSYSEDIDKVRGATSYYARSTSTNTIHQNPPYDSETSMTLTVRRAPAYGTDVILTISSGQMMCPSYEGCSGTVSFDGGSPQRISFAGPADNSSDTIFVEGAASFIAKLKKAKKLVIEKTLYEAGDAQFEFDVDGLKWDH